MNAENGPTLVRIETQSSYLFSDGTRSEVASLEQLDEYYDHLETTLGGCAESESFVTNWADIGDQLRRCWFTRRGQPW